METVVYYLANILTLGIPWVLKIVIKKAIKEANE